MTKKIVFLLEEVSAKELLNGILPKILPSGISFQCVSFEGKSDLEKNIPRKIKGWREPDVKFVILRDQDSGDCGTIKNGLKVLASNAGRNDTLVRIACRELESWYLSDLNAVEQALNISGLSKKTKGSEIPFPGQAWLPFKRVGKTDKWTISESRRFKGNITIS
jgi:hypothetical protein